MTIRLFFTVKTLGFFSIFINRIAMVICHMQKMMLNEKNPETTHRKSRII